MAKRSNQKLKILYLAKILLEQTDAQNGLTLTELLRELHKYGISAERKSVYDDIESLRVFGLNVQTVRTRYIRYYVADRNFDLVELKLIFDLLLESKRMSRVHMEQLLKKFDTPISKDLFCINDESSDTLQQKYINDNYKNISLICKAINSDKKVKFKCFEWNSNKQRVLTSGGEIFFVDPICLELDEDRYVLICFNAKSQNLERYYVNGMISLSLSNQKRNLPSDLDFSSFDKKKENVRFRCKNEFAGRAFDRFGLDVTILANRSDHFEFMAKVEITRQLYSWIFAQGKDIEIISPIHIVDDYQAFVEKGKV